MFKRKNTRSFLARLRELVWPSMGWLRMGQYMRRRVARIDDSARNIALGLALGAAVSFTPLIGLHIVQSVILAYIFRANVLAAVIGTVVGNPWTFPFMWVAGLAVGSSLFSVMGFPASSNLPPEVSPSILWDLLWHDPMRLLFPWLLGGYVLAAASVPVFYMIFVPIIRAAKVAARTAKKHRAHKVAKEGTIDKVVNDTRAKVDD